MADIRTIDHTKDGIRVDFTYKIPGLPTVIDDNGSPVTRLWIPKSQLTSTQITNILKNLKLDSDTKYGFRLQADSDPTMVLGFRMSAIGSSPPPSSFQVANSHSPTRIEGFESQGFHFWEVSVSGQAQVQNSNVLDGDWSARFGYSGGPGSNIGYAQGYLHNQNGSIVASPMSPQYCVFRFKVVSWPTVICEMLGTNGSTPTVYFAVCGASGAGQGLWQVSGNSTAYTGTTVLSLNTVYYGGLFWKWDSDTGGNAKGWVQGKLWDASGTLLETLGIDPAVDPSVVQSGMDSMSSIAVGSMGDNSAAEVIIDSLYTDGAAWPTLGVTSKRMFATGVGTNDAWPTLTPAGGNKWDKVDEVPQDDTDYVSSNGATQIQTFTHGGANAQGGIPTNATILAVAYWARTYVALFGGDMVTRMRDAAGNTQSSAAYGTISSSAWWINSPLFRSVMPNGSAWSSGTIANLDALEIGAASNSNATAKRIICQVLQVYYSVPAATTTGDSLWPKMTPSNFWGPMICLLLSFIYFLVYN